MDRSRAASWSARWMLWVLIWQTACAPRPTSTTPEVAARPAQRLGAESTDEPRGQIILRLSDGEVAAVVETARAEVPARGLSETRTQALMRGLPALPSPSSDRKDFAFRQGPRRPPRAGSEVEDPFPPPTDPKPPRASGATVSALRGP